MMANVASEARWAPLVIDRACKPCANCFKPKVMLKVHACSTLRRSAIYLKLEATVQPDRDDGQHTNSCCISGA
jgi:hypothetical protein